MSWYQVAGWASLLLLVVWAWWYESPQAANRRRREADWERMTGQR